METQLAGRATACFDCRRPKATIERHMPQTREFARVPPEVEIKLTGNLRLMKKEMLDAIQLKAKKDGFAYVMEVMFPGRDNAAAAEEAAAILNQAYNSPLYREGETFRGKIEYVNAAGMTVERK